MDSYCDFFCFNVKKGLKLVYNVFLTRNNKKKFSQFIIFISKNKKRKILNICLSFVYKLLNYFINFFISLKKMNNKFKIKN